MNPALPPPVRSALFMPANREDFMRKGLGYDADALIFDMESAIPRAEAPGARRMVRGVLDDKPDSAPALMVRVSPVASADFASDLDAVVHPNLTAILLPQIIGPDDVRHLEREVLARGGDHLFFFPVMETASAVRQGYEVATSSPRVAYMGGATSRNGDIARSLGYTWSAEGWETMYMRQKVLVDVRSAGVPNPITGVWGTIDDPDGLRAFAEQSRAIGYEGLLCIHPSHVATINEVFSPTPEDIASWQELIAAMDAAEAEGVGAFRHEGRLVDFAHAETARQHLERARRLGLVSGSP